MRAPSGVGWQGHRAQRTPSLNSTTGRRSASIWPKALPAVWLQGALGSSGTLRRPVLVPAVVRPGAA